MSRPDCIEEDVLLGPMTTLEVGGPAKYFAPCQSVDELKRVLEWGQRNDEPVCVLGAGSNVVVSDSGFDGLIAGCRNSGIDFESSGTGVCARADAGVDWDEFVHRCVSEGLAGLECLSGIPGLVGAAPIQNIGAYGQEAGSSIVSVSGIDLRTLREFNVPASACRFDYRTSVFKTAWKSFVVTRVEFYLDRDDSGLVAYPDLKKLLHDSAVPNSAPSLAETRAAVLDIRSKKSMVIAADDPNRRSAGSFFINPVLDDGEYRALQRLVRKKGIAEKVPSFPAGKDAVKVPAAWLIERAGFLRGSSDGAVGLSSKHALAIVNHGGATATEIVRFAARIRDAVRDTFAVQLLPEPVFIGFGQAPAGWLQPVQ